MSMFLQCAPYVGASLALVAIAAYASPRRFGDPEGIPITITTNVTQAFEKRFILHQTSSDKNRKVGLGNWRVGMARLWPASAAKAIYLIGGDSPGKSDVFRKVVTFGESSFAIVLRPGRIMMIGMQIGGGQSDVKLLGRVTTPLTPEARISILLDDDGARILMDPSNVSPVSDANAAR